ncbi:spermatogenesis-associated protein 20 isoform X2 [Zerene cesonia]|nr:spermatogenesis-associated protein 20 isoform X2 [Zerene cesonia]XP_038211975.1 spermatogenesis-associated protein 20 isoform X2 [Zerene cesonia]
MAASSTDGASGEKPKFTNKLIHEKSPYLLQHAHNPVNWYPWGQEAIDKAKEEKKLIFLSVGYSTCHWCHVMERESFENEEIANILNDNFICIKLDREERPDIDRVYMIFIMATSGCGGWPMNLFLTSDLKPVQGGTYYPPEDRWGFKGFKTIIQEIAEHWRTNPQRLLSIGDRVIDHIEKASKLSRNSSAVPGEVTWLKCVEKYMSMYEPDFGGFGTSPKFPQVPAFNFLFHFYARDKNDSKGKQCLDMVLHSLTKMAKGGIHDHISSGFARYSTDGHWHLPHFEKMLYDQAQLVSTYSDAYLATKDEYFADVVHDIIKYVNRDLRHEYGGYYSAEDADSYPYYGAPEKFEGAFYVWEFKELKSLLNDKKIGSHSYLDIFCDYYNVDESGNIPIEYSHKGELQNKNVFIIYGTEEEAIEKFGLTKEQFKEVINECKEILFKYQQSRPRPHLDTKILCSWNGLMIAGLAHAGQCLEEKKYVEDAINTAKFIKKYLYDSETGTLIHSSYKADDGSIVHGDEPIMGLLDDYAFLIRGLIDLHEASLDQQWLQWARELQAKQDELFWDHDVGGYFTCCETDKTVVVRLKEDQDCAEPAGNSVACQNLLRLAAHADKTPAPEGGDKERDMAKKILQAFAKRMQDAPNALPEMISALMLYNDSPTQVLISGRSSDPRTLELVRVVRSRLLPGRVLAVTDPANESPAVLSRIRAAGDAPAAYVCRRYACSLPVTDVKQLEDLLDEPVKRGTNNNNY